MKKPKSRAVKRVSSTKRPRRPKQTVTETFPETVPLPVSSANTAAIATASVAGEKPATGRVVLPASCTIKEAAALKVHLREQLELPGPCEIDGTNVQLVDTAGVQLVLAFALDCLERNLQYVWKGRSKILEDAVRILGVGALLEYPA